MRLTRFVLLCLLLLAAFDASGAQTTVRKDADAAAPRERSGTWSATSSGGLTLVGTWTAVPDTTGGAVTGTWTLGDPQGATVASGAWSASKAATRWNGAWRSIMTGRAGEFAGTWTADGTLAGSAPFVALFEKAAQSVVSGTWRAAGRSGAWSIRALPREGAP